MRSSSFAVVILFFFSTGIACTPSVRSLMNSTSVACSSTNEILNRPRNSYASPSPSISDASKAKHDILDPIVADIADAIGNIQTREIDDIVGIPYYFSRMVAQIAVGLRTLRSLVTYNPGGLDRVLLTADGRADDEFIVVRWHRRKPSASVVNVQNFVYGVDDVSSYCYKLSQALARYWSPGIDPTILRPESSRYVVGISLDADVVRAIPFPPTDSEAMAQQLATTLTESCGPGYKHSVVPGPISPDLDSDRRVWFVLSWIRLNPPFCPWQGPEQSSGLRPPSWQGRPWRPRLTPHRPWSGVQPAEQK